MMRFSLEILAGVTIIFLCAVVITFTIPVQAHHNADARCTTIKEDIDHLEHILKAKGKSGKAWLWNDKGFSMTIVGSRSFRNGIVILSFYDAQGCLVPHPNTGRIRTSVQITDKIKAHIAKSKLYWSNTDDILFKPMGLEI